MNLKFGVTYTRRQVQYTRQRCQPWCSSLGWMTALQAVPTIKRLRGKAEAIRVMELEKAKNKLSDDLTPKQLKTLEDLSRGIMNKMLHAPMQVPPLRRGLSGTGPAVRFDLVAERWEHPPKGGAHLPCVAVGTSCVFGGANLRTSLGPVGCIR